MEKQRKLDAAIKTWILYGILVTFPLIFFQFEIGKLLVWFAWIPITLIFVAIFCWAIDWEIQKVIAGERLRLVAPTFHKLSVNFDRMSFTKIMIAIGTFCAIAGIVWGFTSSSVAPGDFGWLNVFVHERRG